jgi:hypothetical protein
MEQTGLHAYKHCLCPRDHGLAVLLVDLESERVPRYDVQGQRMYYCLKGHHVFSLPPRFSASAEEQRCTEEVIRLK